MVNKIARNAYCPAPNPIGGRGGIKMKTPTPAGTPEKTAAVNMRIIPANMRMKPNRNSLNGVGHGKASTGASCVRWL
jgi:hypothetical protein